MATKPMKSIKLPWLEDTYTFVQNDTTLSVLGAAADAKTTGDKISDVKSAINVLDKIARNAVIPVTSAKHYIDLSGSSVSMQGGEPVISGTSASYDVSVVACYEGVKFTIYGQGGGQTRLWGFVSSTGTILSVASASATEKGKVITAPEGSAFLIVHTKDGRSSYFGEMLDNVLKRVTEADVTGAPSISAIPTGYTFLSGAQILARFPNFPFTITENMSFLFYKLTADPTVGYGTYCIERMIGTDRYYGGSTYGAPNTVNWRNVSYSVLSDAIDDLQEAVTHIHERTIKVLIFGNSSTYSTWGYAPSLIEEFCPGVKCKVGLLYNSGESFSGHITAFNNDTAYTRYSLFEDGVWTNTADEITGKNALVSDEWDIIVIQQSNNAMMSQTGKADADTLCSLISSYIDYPVQIVFSMPMTKGANCSGLSTYYPNISDPEERSDAAFADFATYSEDMLEKSYISHIIPCGTAIQNARHTSLKTYGTYEYLCDDDVGHLQNGIGVLCASYVAAYKVLEIVGETPKLFGSPLSPTDAWLEEIDLLTKTLHGECVGVTNANKILAQRCALQAMKYPYEITAITEEAAEE